VVELAVGTVGTVGTAVAVVLAVAYTAEPAVDIAAVGERVVHVVEDTAAVTHHSLAAAAGAIAVKWQALGIGSEA
jgi:hypothetical protein